MDRLSDRLTRGPVVLDGGLATELEGRGHELAGRLWSARVLADDPRAVLGVHRDFAEAGAEILITASYQASVDGFVKAGVRPSQAWRLIAGSVALARGGAEEAGRDDVLVAGSCGPYAAALADGSEYRGYSQDVTVSQLAAFHRERARILLDAGADLLAFETIPSRREAAAVREVLDGLRPAAAWVSFQTPDGRHTPEGDDLADAARELHDVPGLLLGVNCSAPDVVVPALRGLAVVAREPLVVYPNIGDRWDPEERRWRPGRRRTIDPSTVAEWLAAGARIVGGCCGTTPEDIRNVRAAVAAVAGRSAHDTGNGSSRR